MRRVYLARTPRLLAFLLALAVFWFLFSGKLEIYDARTSESTDTNSVEGDQIAGAGFPTAHNKMSKRLRQLRKVCETYDVQSLPRVWYSASNRQLRPLGCTPKSCPMLVDEDQLLFMCFINKVASSSLKELFLSLKNKTIDTSNSSAFHLQADDELFRVSAAFFSEHQVKRFFKGIFVRHPFDRLVSAYADKAVPGRKERRTFYHNHFIPAMKKFRGNVQNDTIITFKEFVEYLITTHPFFYDMHWSPYWSQCDVCWISYDFVGKLETLAEDFQFLVQHVGIQSLKFPIENRSKRKETLKYIEQLSQQQIVELYKTFFLDFKLFGYSVEEFMAPGTNITSIDESVQLHKLWF